MFVIVNNILEHIWENFVVLILTIIPKDHQDWIIFFPMAYFKTEYSWFEYSWFEYS